MNIWVFTKNVFILPKTNPSKVQSLNISLTLKMCEEVVFK